MPIANTYLLDANVFIEAKRRYYAFDICPGFWDALLMQHENANVASIDRVKKELERGSDELNTWASSTIPESFFRSSDDADVVNNFRELMAWVQNQHQFSEEAKSEFASGTDGWLIACAKKNNMILVTHEVLAPEARKNIPIPNVCEAFSVRYDDTFQMLRALKTQFLLRQT